MESDRELRVVHIIDSLVPGGAETMAVSFVNGLANKAINTSLIVSRKGGLLESKVDKNVKLYILNKKNTFDLNTFIKVYGIIKENKINIIHAHSSSIIWASIIKIFNNKIKLIWHDHYGNSEQLENRSNLLLKTFSGLWSYIIVVNIKLKDWSINKLNIKPENVSFINNFASLDYSNQRIDELEKNENKNCINIVCVANLRPQKDHINLLEAIEIVCNEKKNVLLHLIGVNPNDEYSNNILNRINNNKYKNNILYWGARQNIASWLRYMQIGVIPSKSEGMPVSLLEYGLSGLKVVATNVGEIETVLNNGFFGYLVPPSNPDILAKAIIDVINNPEIANGKAILFKKNVETFYSEVAIIDKLILLYKGVLYKK